MRHCDRADPDELVFEDDDRSLDSAVALRWEMDVDRPPQGARVWHQGVHRHHVQVVGVGGEDVLDQVPRTGGRKLRVDGRLAMEVGIACRQRVGSRRPVDPDRRERPGIADTHAPRVQEHADEIAGVVCVQVREQHGLQASEVESCVDERGRRAATAVDDEHTSVDDERRRDPRAAGDRHRRTRRSQEHQLGCHARRFPKQKASCGRREITSAVKLAHQSSASATSWARIGLVGFSVGAVGIMR